jgi:hypothetical protein
MQTDELALKLFKPSRLDAGCGLQFGPDTSGNLFKQGQHGG